MKTPREILLARHQSVNPKLDQIRRDVIGPPRASFAQTVWRELFLPVRPFWVGLGAVWIAVFALHMATSGETAPSPDAPGPMAADSVMALQRQAWLQAQIDEKTSPPEETVERRPRSEITVKQKIV